MRRLLLALALIAVIVFAGTAGALYVLRDQIFLREARLQAEKLSPTHVEIGTLRTSLLGSFSVELGEVEVRQDKGPAAKIRLVRVESPLGLFGLLRAWSAKKEIPLAVLVKAPKLSAPPGAPVAPSAAPPPASAGLRSLALPVGSPVPIALSVEIQGGAIDGVVTARDVAATLHARLRENGMDAEFSASGSAGSAGGALMPVTASAKVAASAGGVKVRGFTFRLAGLEGSGAGELALSPRKGSFQVSLEAPDLGRVTLRPEDRAALGLTAQPAGSLSFKAEGSADEAGRVSASGALRLAGLVLPLRGPEKTAFAALAPGQHIEGTVTARAELPFHVALAAPAYAPSVSFDKASLAFDLTQAAVVSKGKLEKARGVPLRGELSLLSSPQGVEVPLFSLLFHTLTVSGSASLPAPAGSIVGSSFRLQASSLAGFPALLPMLRAAEGQGAALAEAQGSVQAEGRVRLDTAAPGRSLVDLRALSIRGLRLPLAYASETASLRGVLTGTASGSGRFDAGDVNVSRASGAFDLSGLEIAVPGSYAKRKGRKLVVAFDAAGTPARLAVRKGSLQADGVSVSLAGSAAFGRGREAALNLSASAHADFAALREYLPKLPAKISGGSLDAAVKIGGAWLPAGGIEKSPLLLSGKVTGKLGSVVMPEPPKAAGESAGQAKSPPGALLPPWPAARNADFAFRLDLAEFQRGALRAGGIAAEGSLRKGLFDANISVARAFGGKASLKNVKGSLTGAKLAVRGAASVEGLDLAQAAAFVDPSYGKIVKGSLQADSVFSVPDLWSDKLLFEAQTNGQARVHGGYLSTASFDGLVNEKLKGIPGIGDKAKVNTGGVSAEIRTRFAAAGGAARLTDFVATMPGRDEMRLAGTGNLAFDCDLAGEAHLANAPVRGAVREANSDPEGRLVVPVRFHGNLKSPSADVAAGAIEEMLRKTAAHEGERLKNQALDAAKKKAQQSLQDAAGGLLDGILKR